jgi:hypothetical protein
MSCWGNSIILKRGFLMKAFMTCAVLATSTFFAGSAFAQWGCGDVEDIMYAAHTLDEEAHHFADAVRDVDGYSHLAADAEELSEEAEHFHESVEAGANCDHIRSDFHQLSSAERHLSRAWRHAHDTHHDRHLERDFDIMEDAYYDLQQAVGRGRHDDHRRPVLVVPAA